MKQGIDREKAEIALKSAAQKATFGADLQRAGRFQRISLDEVAKLFLAEDKSFIATKVEIYSSAENIEHIAAEFLKNNLSKIITTFGHPVAMFMGTFNDLTVFNYQQFAFIAKEKNLTLSITPQEVKIPNAPVVIFVSPIPVVDGNSREGEPLRAIGAYKAFLVTFLGRAFLLDKIASFEVSTETSSGPLHFHGPAWRVPQPPDFVGLMDHELYSSILEKFQRQTEPRRSRLLLAFEFFGKALDEFDEHQRFLLYWTSLEVVAGGKSGRIEHILATLYGLSIRDVREKFHLARVGKMRHDLIHRGLIEHFDARTERTVQGIFLDILCSLLDLPPGRILSRIQRADAMKSG